MTVVSAGLANMRLAHDLGAEWVRVFAGGPRHSPVAAETDERGRRRLRHLVMAGERLGVRVALETHDSHPTARDVLRVVGQEDLREVAVIWDVLHTWLHGEQPEETTDQLGSRLAYIQVKDVASRHALAPLPLGSGVLPLREVMRLAREDPSLWVSWEYERAWYPAAPALTELGEPARRWLERAAGDPPFAR